MNKIKLGYELQTGKEISIEPSHLIVTGLTQKAGKTTTLESLIKRSGKKAIVFRTKIGEKSFLAGTIIPPFFTDRSDWQFIESLIESTMKEKVQRMERANIIKLSKQTNGKNLTEFKKRVDQRLTEKISSFESMILTNLQAYLDIVIPKLNTIQFSKTLELAEGLNIIDLERFSRDSEVQSLIIRSVLEEVLYKHQDVIIVIPEAWKFIPQERGNPCKIMVEEFIRQGATNHNYIWIDSQDMSGVDKIPLKQITEWILGYQSEKNEVKHTTDQLPIPKAMKPKEDDIMTLGTGIFYFASRDLTCKVYVQPFWLDDERARKIAMGDLKISELDVKIDYAKNEVKPIQPPQPQQKQADPIKDELNEVRVDFFSKLADIQTQVSIISQNLHELQNNQQTIDESAIIAKVLQKLPTPQLSAPTTSINKDEIIKEVLNRMPKTGNVVYSVPPVEKLKKEFLEETKTKILTDVEALSENAQRMLKYLESVGKGVKTLELEEKCFFMKHSGSSSNKVSESSIELRNIGVADKDTAGWHRGRLKDKIQNMLETHGATEQEIEAVYNHIIYDLLSVESKEVINK